MTSVTVTGATSQIGRFLLPRLTAVDHEVGAISRSPAGMACSSGVHWLAGDIAAAEAFDWPSAEVLIHLAPLRLLPAILPGFLGRGGRRVICFGTTSRFSKAASGNAYEQAFAAAQIAAERQIADICAAAGAHWTLFRPTLIYGCGMDRNVTVIARLIRRFGLFPLFGAASGQRQPVHADDLAAACVAAIANPQTFDKAYDLAGGETLSYRQMVERIFAALHRPARFVTVPMAAFRVALGLISLIPRFRDFNAEMAKRMNDDLVFDSSEATRDFGYAPRTFQPESQ
jgi:nucleoside-diphosphate-sugar epimerase